MWSLKASRQGLTQIKRAIAFTPNGQVLASSSTDGTIRPWDMKIGQTVKRLRPPRPYEGINIADVGG
ncbi:MAG: hypothetical protein ACFB4I_22590 [Cyanophyceae cyanobacterium]